MKKFKYSKQFIAELRKMPNIETACERTGLSRNTVYRWKNEDPEFAILMDEAIEEGVSLMNDLTENQLFQLIKNRDYKAIQLWLKSNHPRYKVQRQENQINNQENNLSTESVESGIATLVTYGKQQIEQNELRSRIDEE